MGGARLSPLLVFPADPLQRGEEEATARPLTRTPGLSDLRTSSSGGPWPPPRPPSPPPPPPAKQAMRHSTFRHPPILAPLHPPLEEAEAPATQHLGQRHPPKP